MPPRYVHTAADFARLIALGSTTEDLFLDFKQTLDGWNAPKGTAEHVRREFQKELCRDVAQFANTDGGVLVVGLVEARNPRGIKVAGSIVHVDLADEMRAWIEDAIKNYCVPSTFSHEIRFVSVADKTVLAVNVLPSLHTVYLYDRASGAFEVIGRTNHGKKRFNPDEIERHIMNGSRAARLQLEAAASAATSSAVMLVGGVVAKGWGTRNYLGGAPSPLQGDITLGNRSDLSFELRIPVGDGLAGVPTLSVPYELLRAAWVDSGRLNLLLEMRVIWQDDRLHFEQLS